jgi:hypothetical protein
VGCARPKSQGPRYPHMHRPRLTDESSRMVAVRIRVAQTDPVPRPVRAELGQPGPVGDIGFANGGLVTCRELTSDTSSPGSLSR